MKKKKKIIIIVSIIILIILAIGIALIIKNRNDEQNQQEEQQQEQQQEQAQTNNIEQDESFEEFKNNSIMYDEEATLSELKEEYKITGPDELYEIQTEYDGRKAIVVKAEINYKTAFAGLIKKSVPAFSELDSIYEENYPKGNGIWIDESSQESIINYLNNTELLNNEYSVNDGGFLQVNQNASETEMDKILEEAINSEKLNLLSISGISYMVDAVTGEIVRNPYEDLDNYQSYEYYEYENNKIIFITENLNQKLTNDEIFESIIQIINN